jgi:hypothetical protein
MSTKASEIKEDAAALIHQTVSRILEKALEDQADFADEMLKVLQDFNEQYMKARQADDAHAFFESWVNFTLQVDERIVHRYDNNQARKLDEIFEEYASVKKSFIGQLPMTYREQQSQARFYPQEGDSGRVRFMKWLKRWGRNFRNLPLNTANIIRRIFGKTPRPARTWKHHIPLRNLTAYYYIEDFSLSLIPDLEKIYYELAVSSQQIWQMIEGVYQEIETALQQINYQEADWLARLPDMNIPLMQKQVNELQQEFRQLESEVEDDVERLLMEVHERFQHAYERAGTLELPAARFSNSRLLKEREHTDRTYLTFVRGWRNTLFALHEDWRLDEEFSTLCNRLLHSHYRLREEADYKIRQMVLPQVNTAERLISNALKSIEQSEEADLQKALLAQRAYVDEQLIRTIIPATIAVLYRQALPAMLDNIQQQTERQVSELPNRRGLVKTNDYSRTIRSQEIDFVSPRQIVGFEILPELNKSVEQSKKMVTSELSHTQKLVNEVGQISYFNLESALSLYQEQPEDTSRAREIALEGLQRALKGIQGIKKDLEEIYRHLDEDVQTAVLTFNRKLIELKSNDYALEIKLRIARARTLERTRRIRQRSLAFVQQAAPALLRLVREKYGRAEKQLDDYRRQMGIELQAVEVSTEISDFLAETEKSIQQLPYVYQRLFSIRPLEEAVFYEERPIEIRQMQEALQNWQKGHFASTVIVGEKGAGITTLVNFFLKQAKQRVLNKYRIIRTDTVTQLSTEAELLSLMNDLFPDQHFEDFDALITYLNGHQPPLIMVFENLEHLYLRKVGGFKCLKRLFEIISRTNHNVLWLCSCTLYAWSYLDKTIRISDYFAYIVSLRAIQARQLQEVILKRHRVSGYRIHYESSEADRQRKKFNRMDEEEKQHYLQQAYFIDLNRITSGNFSIAQLFWLRSTRRVKDDTIYIGSLKDYDFSFVRAIPLHHVLTLHLLLLHDGLSEEHYREIAEYRELGGTGNHKAGNNLNLLQLQDDGLIVRRGQNYLINPLLYRQVVGLLQSKNFLH